MKKSLLKVVSLAAASVLALTGLCSCGGSSDGGNNGGDGAKNKDFKVGLICLHDENSTYDLNFINSLEAAKKNLGLSDDQILIKKNIPESNECKEAAADLADHGCDIIFADSFGHEPYLLEAAAEYPEVQFCHATGTMAHTENKDNFHNAFASIYEGRYVAGVAAGLKLNEMIAAGEITAEQKASEISALLQDVQPGQSLGLLLVMTVIPCVLMFLSYILYKKHYKLDEAEYDRICRELQERKA